MNKERQKQLEAEKITIKARFKEFFPDEYKLAFPEETSPEVEEINDNGNISLEELEVDIDEDEELDLVEIVEPEPEPTLQEELEEVVKDVVDEVLEEAEEKLIVPDDSHIQKFLAELLEKDEDKLVEILRKLK